MSIIYTETKSDKDSRTWIDIGDGRNMTVNVTSEGIIMDVYQIVDVFDNPNAEPVGEHTEHVGTAGMMFDEWADWVQTRIDPSLKIGESVL
jgi:hypothetical protein